MIEQINGTGLSGISGKSTKHGKNSLFAKLLAMLEKNAETSGKGKGLQLSAANSGKAKGLLSLAEKTDPVLAAKSKLLLALATKEKAEGKEKIDESATPLFAAHVIIDQASQTKKSDTIGKVSLLIEGQVTGQAHGKVGTQGAEKGAEPGADKTAFIKGADKLDLGNNVLNEKAQGMSAKADGMPVSQFNGELGKQVQALDSESTRLVSDKVATDISALAQKSQGAEQSVKAASLTGIGQLEANAQPTLNKSDSTDRAGLEDKKADLIGLAKQGLGEKSVAKTPAEVMGAAVGAHLQHAKAVQAHQSQQAQQINANAVASGVQVTMSEASLGDSGSQFSDNKGGQGTQASSSMLGDVKSTGSSSSANANFQSYLTSKAAPVLSVFDSMNHIAQSAKNGQTRLEIQLDPANLGKIQISLQSDASKHLQVHMIVDQSMTRTALEQQLPQLRTALAQQGFDLSGFSMDSQGQQASSGGDGHGARSQAGANQLEKVMVDGSLPTQTQQAMTGSGLSIRV
ncbi:flagellar hook-length control protein FliK [Mariprofundus sp. EBB-1]|uniref:flagellar hook-length control protein FliK n=1 Tax=Mariprofundus sp. EBB-1 TaxID=2650971 RepID=UPI00137B3242|nr:flagellar hook-length control protein FliK [Mariprofundus sp. EBB-1]